MARSAQGKVKMERAKAKLRKQRDDLFYVVDTKIKIQEMHICRHKEKVAVMESNRDDIENYFDKLIEKEKG